MYVGSSVSKNNFDKLKNNLMPPQKVERKLSDHTDGNISFTNCDNHNDENTILNANLQSGQADIIENTTVSDLKTILQMLTSGIEKKKNSNLHLKNHNYLEAREGYLKALDCFKIENDKLNTVLNLSSLDGVRNECLNNLAFCSNMLKDYQSLLTYSNEVLSRNKNDFKALCLQAKALIKLERNKEALNVVKRALCIKPTKTLFEYLKIVELKISAQDVSFSTIDENEVSSASSKSSSVKKQELEPIKQEEIQKFISHFTIVRIFKVLSHKVFCLIRKNKLLFAILLFAMIYYFKQELSKMYEKVLDLVKF